MRGERSSWRQLARPWAVHTARAHSDAASLQVLVLLKTRGKGSRSEGKALQRAAASARMWLESATVMDWVLRRMMQRLCEFGALRRRRGMHKLRSIWGASLLTVKVSRRTLQRQCVSGVLPLHRGIQMLSSTWAKCLRAVKVLLRMMRRLCASSALQQHRGKLELSTTWASCLPTVKVLRRTLRRQCDCTALQQHKVLHMRSFGLGLGKQRCMLLRIVAEACKLGGQLQ
jgi:hypothetical protein